MRNIIAICLLAITASAQQLPTPPQNEAQRIDAVSHVSAAPQNFNAGEFNVDAFGVLSRPDLTGAPRWGEGIGVSYFITRGLGFGIRATTYNNDGPFVDETEARIIFRAPLWDRIAPYAFLSGIYSFDAETPGAGAGGGLEYRFNRNLGVFGETGLRVATDGKNDWQTCAGIRLAF